MVTLTVHCAYCGRPVRTVPASGGSSGASYGGLCVPLCAEARAAVGAEVARAMDADSGVVARCSGRAQMEGSTPSSAGNSVGVAGKL